MFPIRIWPGLKQYHQKIVMACRPHKDILDPYIHVVQTWDLYSVIMSFNWRLFMLSIKLILKICLLPLLHFMISLPKQKQKKQKFVTFWILWTKFIALSMSLLLALLTRAYITRDNLGVLPDPRLYISWLSLGTRVKINIVFMFVHN